MKPSYLDSVSFKEEFNPEGTGYDYRNAIDSGGEPDENRHWGSLDPRTGMVLKGRQHETWDLMVEEETKLGNTIVKGESGRYYSVKLPEYLKSIKAPNMPEPEDAQLQAAKDYEYAMNYKKPMGFWKQMHYEWGNPEGSVVPGVFKKVPGFAGQVSQTYENDILAETYERVTNWTDFDYQTKAIRFKDPRDEIMLGRITQDEIDADPYALHVWANKKEDEDLMAGYIKYMSTEKTKMAGLASGISILPTWLMDFYMTGGLYKLGDDAAIKAGEKIIGQYAKSRMGKLALKVAGWGAGTTMRTTLGLYPNVIAEESQAHLDTIMGLQEDEGWASRALDAYGSVWVSAASEEFFGEGAVGTEAFKALPFGSKFIDALAPAWIKVTGGTKGEFFRKLGTKMGYSNIIGEVGEEEVETILRAITGLDDFGAGEDATMLERLKYGMIQDIENIWVTLGVLALPTAAQYVGSRFVADEHIIKLRNEVAGIANVEDVVEPTKIKEEAVKPAQPTAEAQEAEQVAEPEAVVEQPTPEAKPTEAPKVEEEFVGPPKPIIIKEANTSDDVNKVTEHLVTGKTNPEAFSLREADVLEEREFLGLHGAPSKSRQTMLETYQKAVQDGQVERAEENATRVMAGGRGMDRFESAGARVKMAQLHQKIKENERKIAEATEPASIKILSEIGNRLQKQFDFLSEASLKSGTEAGRELQFRKFAIDQNYDIVYLKARAKRHKGSDLTAEENSALEEKAKEIKRLEKKIEQLERANRKSVRKDFMEQGSVARYRNMNKADIMFERESLMDKISTLLEEGC